MHPNEPLSKKLSLGKKSVHQFSDVVLVKKKKEHQKKQNVSGIITFFLLRAFLLFLLIWSINWSFFSPLCLFLLVLFALHNDLDSQFFVQFCHPPKSFPDFFLFSSLSYFPSNNSQNAEIDQQHVVVVNQRHEKLLTLTLSLTRFGDYRVFCSLYSLSMFLLARPGIFLLSFSMFHLSKK